MAGALVVAIAKPWAAGRPSPSLPQPSVAAVPSPEQARAAGAGFNPLAYDPAIFGTHEPAATWAVWLAGYLVTFGFVTQLADPGASQATEAPPAAPVAGASPSLLSTPVTASPWPSSLPSARPGGPGWPTRFDVPDGNHLFLIGVNMPLGYELASARLFRSGVRVAGPVPIAQFDPSPWPNHFAVLGVPDGRGQLVVWGPGVYRLDLTFSPGGITRLIEIGVGGASNP